MKRHLKKLLVIFVGIIFTLPCITISNSYAQEKTATVGADKIKSILLGQKEWEIEWSCTSGSTSGYAGLTDVIFEDHGKKIVAKMNNPDYRKKCKKKVTITSDGFKMYSCWDNDASMIFDPNDHRYPFKGDNQACIFKLRKE